MKNFVHKDFEFVNLFFLENCESHLQCGIIDFQSAFMGFIGWDLISLLENPRINFTRDYNDKLIEYFYDNTSIIENLNTFLEQYYVLSLARQTRLLGRWRKLLSINNDNQYLDYLKITKSRTIATLNNIKKNSSKKNNNYKEFLEAFIIGYDVAARIGLACNLNLNMHPHGTWGGVGAAAALARLLKLDGNDTKELLNIASSLTLATSRKTMLEGGTVRNTYAGISNQMALMSLKLLTAGFCGETDGIKSVFGSVVSNNLDENKACENIGARFEINRNYFKLYSCCRYNHDPDARTQWKTVYQRPYHPRCRSNLVSTC